MAHLRGEDKAIFRRRVGATQAAPLDGDGSAGAAAGIV
jgi:hypothetical protein